MPRLGKWALCFLLALGSTSFAADLYCDVCGMKILENSKSHIILKSDVPNKKPLNACSLPCAHKARKHDPHYSRIEIADFNHPEKFLSTDSAFFLIKSDKIKSELGEMTMPPFVAAFGSQSDAEAARKKYDGLIVRDFESIK